MVTTIQPDAIFDGYQWRENCPIRIDNGVVVSFDTEDGSYIQKVPGVIVPGFIDVQVNGGGGYLFNHDTHLDALYAMSNAHAKHGTTAFLPTLITSDYDTLAKSADVISQAIALKVPGVIGVHFEGPHISNVKKGIHNSALMRPISDAELEIYCRKDLGKKIVTLAPEFVDLETIRLLVDNDVHVCIGHSNATYEQTKAAVDAGATGFTHLFNAMSGLESRQPNVVGAALVEEGTWCGIILDGHHVHPMSASIALKAKTPEKLMLVSDAMSTIGSKQSQFHFDGHDILLHGDKLTSHSGQLAGSALTMDLAVKNAVKMLGVSFPDALTMASLTPASFLGIANDVGQLSVGSSADMVLLSHLENNPCQVTHTWIKGKLIY